MNRQRNRSFSVCRKPGLYAVCLLAGILLSGCSATSFLKEGESFYAGAKVNFDVHGNISGKKTLKSELEEMITPKPNATFLGARPGVWMYYATRGDDDSERKGFKGWLRKKFGREPVLLSDAKPEVTADVLKGNLFNRGFFESQVRSSVEKKKKKGYVIYDVDLYPPFTIREITVPRDSIFTSEEDLMKESFIKEDQRYNLEKLSDEQSRIEMYLEDFGYYYFDNRNLLFEADTTVGGRQIDLNLTYARDIPRRARTKYRFRNIDIINDYSASNIGGDTIVSGDTVRVEGYRYISLNENFRPEIIANVINIRKGELYSRTAHTYTISHLMGLGTFKFVNIRYDEAGDSLLDASIFLTPLKKKSFRLEVLGVSKSNNFVGPGVGVTFTNRNFLKGAEQFQLKVNGSYEVQITHQQPEPLMAVELSAEASLTVPRMLLPFRIRYYSTKYIPHTDFRIGSTFQRRIGYFQLNSFNAGFGYTWRETTTKSHTLYPIDVNYVDVSQQSEQFEDLLAKNPYLRNSFQDQFIPGMRYSFTLNTQLQDLSEVDYRSIKTRRSNFFFNGNFSLAGNLVNWLTPDPKSPEDSASVVFGQPFSQFALGDVDFRYYWQIDRHNRLVARLAFGAGYAYGNSNFLPYIKQFATGGSNSIRAFPARSVGPGTYPGLANSENVQFIDQRGDIKLEANLEYRFDIYRFLKGAVFLDAGNIWLWNEDPNRPGGEFNKDTFLKELAVGTGVGVRLDFSFFILRLDLGIPLRKPWLEGEQWVARDIDFSSKTWRKDNFVFNIAIGYPF